MVDTLRPAILGLLSFAKLGIVELNCAVNLQKKKLVQQKKPTTEGRKVKQVQQMLKPPPLNTKSRHIQIDLKELAVSQQHTTSPYAVMPNPLYMHHGSAQLLCGHWCEKN